VASRWSAIRQKGSLGENGIRRRPVSGFGYRCIPFYPTVLIVIASYYVLYALMGAFGRALAIEKSLFTSSALARPCHSHSTKPVRKEDESAYRALTLGVADAQKSAQR
jgi:hypothetical protein